MNKETEIATLAGGCFWCTEAIFQRLSGVVSVIPGYAGGHVPNPSYEQVTMGNTGHAEAIQIVFDPQQLAYEMLLDVFWHTHNPTTINQQGYDIGPQYRSVIFYHSPQQLKIAELSLEKIVAEELYNDPVVTEIIPFTDFYLAEEYHQNYYNTHQDAAYCSAVIDPKLVKLAKMYSVVSTPTTSK
ncbi:MAG: peptide-methionine (S)-S-oxide reductase MsrA [bacterium]|nr:peptide-methionine (S)-S-oxide reductase MsrA [bacterium]